MFSPVNKKSLAETVFEQIRDQILAGNVEPGGKLPAERALCEMLGVNRSVLREAIKRLEQAKLVHVQQGSGAMVTDFKDLASLDLLPAMLITDGQLNVAVARSIMEMRQAIAPDAARLCAMRRDESVVQELRAHLAELQEKPNADQQDDVTIRYWQTVVRGSENIAYQLAYNSLRLTYEKLQELLRGPLQAERDQPDAYRKLTVAIDRQDTDQAAFHGRAIVQAGTEAIQTLLDLVAENNTNTDSQTGAT